MAIFDTLAIGVSGLNAAEMQITTTGHNISNIDNESYTRQRVVQTAKEPFHNIPGDVGNGTQVDQIIRIHDEFSYNRLKNSESALSYTGYKQDILQEIAQRFPDLKDVGILKDLENYFNAWNNFASKSSDGSQKINLIQITQTLSENIRKTSDELYKMKKTVNDQLKINVEEFNRLGQQIADINAEIARIESVKGNNANDLRDKRDQLERAMAKLVNITAFKGSLESNTAIDRNITDMGQDYSLNLGGFGIVEGTAFHPLVLKSESAASDFQAIYYERQDGRLINIMPSITGGQIGAELELRGRYIDASTGQTSDGTIQSYINNLDTFAKTLITQTNNIYAKSAQNKVNSNDLSFLKPENSLINFDDTIKEGTFDVVVYDKQGKEVARKTIEINRTTAMNSGLDSNSIVTQFNTNSDDNKDKNSLNDVDDYFSASYIYHDDKNLGQLSINPKFNNDEYFISFEDNGTNFPGVVGLNRFFDGNSSKNIRVNSVLSDDPVKLQGFKAPIDGNNEVANEIVQLQYKKLEFNGKNSFGKEETIEGFYRFLTTQIAAQTETNNNAHETNKALYTTALQEFQSISGVSMNEELTNLIRFQSSYGASAKIITTVEKMLDTLLTLKQ
ncbi:flagellar hook-associated protein FlgK [Campylobacter sputorum]|uniref:flagellar hook-associated protein FlgK n=1 Tax=Campylobacter sputorum TaxID=206 RepID=UPI000B76CDEF|nr:flagellar hook-associated protein FlgK [Campylobacter sputorum]ASM36928.1 flagellar hook-associated protein [Campylobacter sputorum bv. faecalis CCUG 20703]